MFDTIQHGSFSWHHILNPSEKNLSQLQDLYDFHPLDIEDCKTRVHRPKIDIYDDYYFIILHFPYFDKSNETLITKEVKIFWGKDYIITIGDSHWIVKDYFNKAKANPEILEELSAANSDALLYAIFERLIKETFFIILRVGNMVNMINTDLFNKHSKRIIESISITRKNLILLNTIIKPQLRLFHKFESGEVKGYAEDMEEYWGNILDYYQKCWDLIEDYEELIEGLSTTFDSLQANRTNEIMKILTFISTILLPLTFITGLYGMNIRLPFQESPYFFWVLIFSMVSIVGFFIFFFRKKNMM